MRRSERPRHLYYTFGIMPNICGGRAHIERFARTLAERGWQLWGPPGDRGCESAGMTPLPAAWPARIRALRGAHVVYARIEDRIDWTHFSRFACRPWKRLIGNPLVAWEFNTVPEYATLHGETDADVRRHAAEMKRLGRDCDVAFCVSEKIAGYVESELGIRQVVVVPNGSDPDVFSPTVPVVRRLREDGAALRVVWMGGGDVGWHDFDLLRQIAEGVWRGGFGERIRFFVISGRCPRIGEMPPNVMGVGQVPYAELPGWLSGMHVGLCLYRPGPADYSSPLKLYDYMAAGLAVLSTPQPQAMSVLRQAGFDHAIHETAEGFAQSLMTFEKDPGAARREGETLRALLVRRFTWNHTCDRILARMEGML